MTPFLTGFTDEMAKLALANVGRQFLTSAGITGGVHALADPGARAGDITRSAVGFGAGDVAGTTLARALGAKGMGQVLAGLAGGIYGEHKMRRKRKKVTPEQREQLLGQMHKTSAAPRSHLTPASSNVRGFRYDPKTKQLFITFKGGGTYRYDAVPARVAKALKRNKSAGKTVNRLVKKPGYAYEKIGRELSPKHYGNKCRFCGDVSTKGVIWADGRGIVYACDKHTGKAKSKVSDVVAVRDLTKRAGVTPDTKLLVEARDPDGSLKRMLEHIAKAANGGHSFEVVVDPDDSEYRKSFGFDGDGAFHLGTVKEAVARLFCKRAEYEASGPPAHDGWQTHAGGVPFVAERVTMPGLLRERVREGLKKKKASIIKEANGDMIEYLSKHPQKLKEYNERQAAKKKATKKKASPNHPTAQERFYTSTKMSPYYAKKQREKRKRRTPLTMQEIARFGSGGMGKKAQGVSTRDQGFAGVGGSADLSSSDGQSFVDKRTSVDKPKLKVPLKKAARAGSGAGFAGSTGEGYHVGQWNANTLVDPSVNVIAGMKKKTRQVKKLAGACVKTLTWGGLTMKFEYLTGQTRSGTNKATGKSWSRKMRDNYGYIPGTYGKGADGEAIDVYFSDEPLDGPVFKIKQKKKTGEYDEDKFMVGYGSGHAAKRAFLRNMPEWAFGSMMSMSMDGFRKLVGQAGRKVRVPSDGNAERDRVRKALKGTAA